MADFKAINSPKAPSPLGTYSQAIQVEKASRTLFVSGQIPEDADGKVPVSFDDQARLVWNNIAYQLEAADMDLSNIVKHTTYLSHRKYRAENSKVRKEVLSGHMPALTVIVAEIYSEKWLLEIEAIAVD